MPLIGGGSGGRYESLGKVTVGVVVGPCCKAELSSTEGLWRAPGTGGTEREGVEVTGE